MKPYNERQQAAILLKKVLDKYLYLTDKIQNEVIHADTLMLYRKVEVELKTECEKLKEILAR